MKSRYAKKRSSMKAISGRSSAVSGSLTTLVADPAAGGAALSSGFKFTSAMLTYFGSPITEIDGRSDGVQPASHRILVRPSCRAHHNDDCAATQKGARCRPESRIVTLLKPPYVQAAGQEETTKWP